MKKKGSKTLNLDGLIPALEDDEANYSQLKQRAQAWIYDRGIKLPEQPMKNGKPLQPEIPKGADGSPTFEHLPLENLTQLSAEILAYSQYGNTLLSDLKADKIVLNGKLESLESKLIALLPPPEASKKARMKNDRRWKRLKLEVDDVELRITLLAPTVAGLDKAMDLLSREITVRTSDKERVERDSNLNRRGNRGIPGGRRVR